MAKRTSAYILTSLFVELMEVHRTVGEVAIGAMLAGAITAKVVESTLGQVAMGSMTIKERFTLISNVIAIAAVIAVTRSLIVAPKTSAS